jgi:hypothetical protein
MRRLGFSIAGLMVLVGYVAMACAAFRACSSLWASIAFTLTIATLASAAILAICGRARPALAGMAISGLVYVHFAFGQIEYPSLVTSYLLDSSAEEVLGGRPGEIAYYSRQGQFVTSLDLKTAIENTTKSVPVNSIDLLAYRQIGHSTIGLLVGAIGAAFGQFVSQKHRQPR